MRSGFECLADFLPAVSTDVTSADAVFLGDTAPSRTFGVYLLVHAFRGFRVYSAKYGLLDFLSHVPETVMGYLSRFLSAPPAMVVLLDVRRSFFEESLLPHSVVLVHSNRAQEVEYLFSERHTGYFERISDLTVLSIPWYFDPT